MSRVENILHAIIDGIEYEIPAGSRVEQMLLDLKAVLQNGGGTGSGGNATPLTEEQLNNLVSTIDTDDQGGN